MTDQPGLDLTSGPPAAQELPAGITQTDVDRFEARQQARAEAGTVPLPGPLLGAFAGGSQVDVAGFKVRPLCHYDFVVLQILGSPLLEMMKPREAGAPGVPYSDDQAYEIVWQFTRSPRELHAHFTGRPREQAAAEFRATAFDQVGARLGPVEVGVLVQGVVEEFVRYFSTAIKYGSKVEPGEVTFPSPPAQGTASAGGSITSAV